MVHYTHISWGRTSMIELFRDLWVINVLAKFENDPWKIMDVRVLTGLVCPAARPPARSGDDNTPEPLKGCGVQMSRAIFVSGTIIDLDGDCSKLSLRKHLRSEGSGKWRACRVIVLSSEMCDQWTQRGWDKMNTFLHMTVTSWWAR